MVTGASLARETPTAFGRSQTIFTMSKRNPPGPEEQGGNCFPNSGNLFQRAAVRHSRRPRQKSGGADRDRTDDLMLAKHVLSQLSYSPGFIGFVQVMDPGFRRDDVMKRTSLFQDPSP